jgi:hypothetical protein
MMMKEPQLYDVFPLRIVIFRLALASAFLMLAALILSFWGTVFLIGYVFLAAAVFTWIMANVCTSCAYHGRRCDLALGLLAGILFKEQRDNRRFWRKGKKSLPMLYLLAAMPALAGAALLIRTFSNQILIMTLVYLFISIVFFLSTPVVSCPHCLMRDFCPACRAFRKKSEKSCHS